MVIGCGDVTSTEYRRENFWNPLKKEDVSSVMDTRQKILTNLEDKNQRMEFLKRRARRNGLIQEVSKYLNISTESFMEIEENDQFCKNVFEKLETIEATRIIQVLDYRHPNYEQLRYDSQETLSELNISSQNGRLFFSRESEVEAIKFKVDDIFKNLPIVLRLTKFISGHGDFILVADDWGFAICLLRMEYHNELIVWGLNE